MLTRLFLKGRMTSSYKAIVYVSFFVALTINAHKLITTLHPEVELIADIPWTFNLFEFLYQVVYTWAYFLVLGVLLFSEASFNKYDSSKEKFQKIGLLVLFFTSSLFLGLISQKYLFDNLMNSKVFRSDFILRFFIGSGLIYVLVRVLRISEDRKVKALENERLKSAYSDAQLKNLRAQINPHFFFNALANLSSLINEDVEMAQQYVGNLSKVFRYSLSENTSPLIELTKELESLTAYIDLLKIRYQDNLKIAMEIENAAHYMVPVMSLQPLLDNVTKHNVISTLSPGVIVINIKKDQLYFQNTITVQKPDAVSNGIGLYNLNERFKLLMDKEIKISKTENEFLVILPLLKKES